MEVIFIAIDEPELATGLSPTDAIAVFRGKGKSKGGAVERLLMDRKADHAREG